MGFQYGSSGKRCNLRTLRHNVPMLWDILHEGERSRAVSAAIAQFAPDVVISDAEPFTHHAARRLRIPRMGFDHFGVMVYCRLPMPLADRLTSFFDRSIYKLMCGQPDRVLVSSFYEVMPVDASVETVGPLLRREVYGVRPSEGQHVLAYLNRGDAQLQPHVHRALAEAGPEIRLYGTSRTGREGNLVYRKPGSEPFLKDLASCRAVISTAGNQLVGEALHFGKPLLVLPEACVEQRLNAAAVERLGIGETSGFPELSPNRVRAFLERAPHYALAARRNATDGCRDAIEKIEGWIRGARAAAPVRTLARVAA